MTYVSLLDDIHEGRVRDRHCRLRGRLLRHLYPRIVGPADVVRYLIDDPEHYIGEYTMWVGHGLVPATNPADIPQLLDAVSACAVDADPIKRFSWRRFVGHLLQEGLSRYGEVVAASQLNRWLGASLDKNEFMFAGRGTRKSHPELASGTPRPNF